MYGWHIRFTVLSFMETDLIHCTYDNYIVPMIIYTTYLRNRALRLCLTDQRLYCKHVHVGGRYIIGSGTLSKHLPRGRSLFVPVH